jgi:hypothetical protein
MLFSPERNQATEYAAEKQNSSDLFELGPP